MSRRTHVVICERCGYSVVLRVPDLPVSCATCRDRGETRPAVWRLAAPGEITAADRRFLHSLRIASEDKD